jgi:exopolyphosphatase / guanosine-5'-triphosphate,3'-diphosphate pyrophosphatase
VPASGVPASPSFTTSESGSSSRMTDAAETLSDVRVGVIDVGSNSIRLLVASVEPKGKPREVDRDRVYLRLGDDVHTLRRIGARKLNELELIAERYAQQAWAARVERLETIVTAPGRQAANADELVDVLADATRAPVCVLSAEEEATLAWQGAVSFLDDPPGRVAVVDLGGGSCELAVGRRGGAPDWVRSRDAGALRVTRELFSRNRRVRDLAGARTAVAALLEGIDAPASDLALAVGGTARAVGRLVGERFGVRKLDAFADRLAEEGSNAVREGVDVTQSRRETLLGGTLVLAEVARLLDSKLEVGRGGLREGAVLALARETSVAA